jgi:chitin disaccharide deacetylase
MQDFLIVNADDFGLSDGVNEGIIRAHSEGIVTSTSLMVRMPAAVSAARLADDHPGLSVGLHMDIGEWQFRSEEWVPLYERVPQADAEAVAGELEAQLHLFTQLTGKNPTHIDSHQHAHMREPLRSLIISAASRLGIPLRHFSDVRYCGDFYGQDECGEALVGRTTAEFLANTIEAASVGAMEVSCHPAAFVDFAGVYANERLAELAALCSPRARNAISKRGMRLISFAQLTNKH